MLKMWLFTAVITVREQSLFMGCEQGNKMSWFWSSIIMLQHLVSFCRSNETDDNPGAFDILSSIPDDLAYKILDCLSLSQRMVASLACKQWRNMCIDNLPDVNITLENLQLFETAQIWLSETLKGRQSALRSLVLQYRQDLPSDWHHRYHRLTNLLTVPGGNLANKFLLRTSCTISCTCCSQLWISSWVNSLDLQKLVNMLHGSTAQACLFLIWRTPLWACKYCKIIPMSWHNPNLEARNQCVSSWRKEPAYQNVLGRCLCHNYHD